MQQIIAIALLSIRNAIRSKIVISLLILLMVVIVVLPISIKGDGTIAGLIQVLLSYTLGLASFILTVTTLWAGSASVASEINDKTIHMVATKPVSKWQLWMGKWVGLTIMNAGLWLICGLVTYGMLQWHLHPTRLSKPEQQVEAERLLTARKVIRPQQPDFQKLARQRVDEQMSRSPLAEGVTREMALRQAQQQIANEVNTIRPGSQGQWNFGIVPLDATRRTVTLQYRLASSQIGHTSIKSRWLIGAPNRPDTIEVIRDSVPRAQNHFTFQLDEQWKNTPLVITYVDVDGDGATLIFDIADGMLLLVPQGGFVPNYVRGLLILFGQIAFFTALGVTAGSLFSLPVASFVSLFFLILIQMGSYIEGIAQNKIILPWQAASPDEVMNWSTVIIAVIFKLLAFLLSPLTHESVLNFLSTGRLIDSLWTLNGLIVQGVVYALVMSGFATYVMNRRELALPAS